MNYNTDAKKRTCTIEGCNKNHEAKGYCSMHYRRWKRYGDPLHLKKRKPCKVEGCVKLSRNWGYCPTHASRYYAHGDPLKTLLNTENNGKCSVKGCDGKYVGKGLCNTHYKRERYKVISKTKTGRLKYQTQYEKRRARKNNSPFNDFTGDDWLSCLKAFDNSCAYCGAVGDLERDHVIPMSNGGSHTKSNVVPCCVTCNRRKWANALEDWYPVQDFHSKYREEKILKWTGHKVKGDKIQMQLF